MRGEGGVLRQEAEALEFFLHVGHVVVVEAGGGGAAQFAIPAEALVHHAECGLEVVAIHFDGAFGEGFFVGVNLEGPLGDDVVVVAQVGIAIRAVGLRHAAYRVGALQRHDFCAGLVEVVRCDILAGDSIEELRFQVEVAAVVAGALGAHGHGPRPVAQRERVV